MNVSTLAIAAVLVSQSPGGAATPEPAPEVSSEAAPQAFVFWGVGNWPDEIYGVAARLRRKVEATTGWTHRPADIDELDAHARRCKPKAGPRCGGQLAEKLDAQWVVIFNLPSKRRLKLWLIDASGKKAFQTAGKLEDPASAAVIGEELVTYLEANHPAPPPPPEPEAEPEAEPEPEPEPEPEATLLEPAPDTAPDPEPLPDPSEVAPDPTPEGEVQPPEEVPPEETTEWSMDAVDPIIAHAEAQLAEVDGHLNEALDLLRQASQAAPEDRVIAFDLARVAVAAGSETLEQDTQLFLSQEDTSPAAESLRSLIAAGSSGPPTDEVRSAALGLSMDVQPEPAREEPKLFRASVRLGAEADSNVTVLPDASPSREVGMRGLVGLGLTLSPMQGPLKVEPFIAASLSAHVNDSSFLGQFDVAQGTGGVNLLWQRERWRVHSAVTASLVGLNPLSTASGGAALFLADYGALLAVEHHLGNVRLGAYASGGYRDFTFQNAEGAATDRDGARVEGGISGGVGLGAVRLTLRTGYQAELASGSAQREHGLRSSLGASTTVQRFSAALSVNHWLRNYPDGKLADTPATQRLDNRITPAVQLAVQLSDVFALTGRYAFIKNLSNAGFDYTRHLGQAAVEARW